MSFGAWQPLTAYTADPATIVTNGSNNYRCTVAGTSGTLVSGGPVGQTPGIDGTVTWRYFPPPMLAVDKPNITIAQRSRRVSAINLQRFSGLGLMVDHTDEGALAVSADDARWTPITLDFTLGQNMLACVIARIGTDSALTMVVYDESIDGPLSNAQDGYQPLFADKSTITITGSLGEGRVVSMSVLPNGGWIRENVVLVPYSAWEIQ